MKYKNKILLLISLLLLPTIVFASDGNSEFPVGVALGIEAFVSIHMSFFVLKPISLMISKEDSRKTFWKLFIGRVIILLFCDFFVTPSIALIDFIGVFVGVSIIVPICSLITKTRIKTGSNQVMTPVTPSRNQVNDLEYRCSKCNAILKSTYKFCTSCGAPFDKNSAIVSGIVTDSKVAVLPSNFDNIYSLTEDKMLEEFINRELVKAGIDKSSKLIPTDALKRKIILNIIFSVLVSVFLTLIFFHFPIYTYVFGIIILFIFFKVTRDYTSIKYLKKQIKARPSEKISNIVMSVKNTFVVDNSRVVFVISLLVAIVLPLIIFSSPRIIYEKVDGGYAVRYYIFGLTNYKTATIPETYKNEKVVSLRGNTFSNMPFLESVSLPDSVTEIRGQAFKNCYKLSEVNIPKNLEYLGGGAFYNAKSINKIELPDTLTHLGGESFYGAESLEYVKLSNNLSEIRGDSFKYCTLLKSITIPDNVIRIGGHAFYGDSSLSEVLISENSKLNEIGSSAFRQCSSLYSITIPSITYVNERAFKESPTQIQKYGDANTINDDVSFTNTYKNKYEKLYLDAYHSDIDEYLFNVGDIVYFSKFNLIISLENVNEYNDYSLFINTDNDEKYKIYHGNSSIQDRFFIFHKYKINFKPSEEKGKLWVKIEEINGIDDLKKGTNITLNKNVEKSFSQHNNLLLTYVEDNGTDVIVKLDGIEKCLLDNCEIISLNKEKGYIVINERLLLKYYHNTDDTLQLVIYGG